MSNLDELYLYKNTLMELLCSDSAIVALVMDSKEAECPNKAMPYSRVFPYNHVPDVTKEAMVYVCFDVEIRRVPNKTILYPDVYVWAFCHKSLMRLPGGSGVRPDKLVCEINHVLSGSPCLGAGPLELMGLSSVSPIDYHWGKLLHYATVDFNRPSASYGDLRGGRRGRYG
ncbi:MAG: hypothetical protein FWC27_02480 [Firmicutes bacterium]|nr:hypothetical protein [Bacillota bacterium]